MVPCQSMLPHLLGKQKSQVSDCRYLGNPHSTSGLIIIISVKRAKIDLRTMANIIYEFIIRIFHVVYQFCCTFRGQISHPSLLNYAVAKNVISQFRGLVLDNARVFIDNLRERIQRLTLTKRTQLFVKCVFYSQCGVK